MQRCIRLLQLQDELIIHHLCSNMGTDLTGTGLQGIKDKILKGIVGADLQGINLRQKYPYGQLVFVQTKQGLQDTISQLDCNLSIYKWYRFLGTGIACTHHLWCVIFDVAADWPSLIPQRED